MRQQIDQQLVEVMDRKKVIQTFMRQVESCSWKYPKAYSKTTPLAPVSVLKKSTSNFLFKLPPIKNFQAGKNFNSNLNTTRKFHHERFPTQQNVLSKSVSETDDRKVEPTVHLKSLESNPIFQIVKDYEKKQQTKNKQTTPKKMTSPQKLK